MWQCLVRCPRDRTFCLRFPKLVDVGPATVVLILPARPRHPSSSIVDFSQSLIFSPKVCRSTQGRGRSREVPWGHAPVRMYRRLVWGVSTGSIPKSGRAEFHFEIGALPLLNAEHHHCVLCVCERDRAFGPIFRPPPSRERPPRRVGPPHGVPKASCSSGASRPRSPSASTSSSPPSRAAPRCRRRLERALRSRRPPEPRRCGCPWILSFAPSARAPRENRGTSLGASGASATGDL